MKILFVAGQHAYGDPARGPGYEYVNMLPAFGRLGHDVLFFESFDRSVHADFAELNVRLLQTVRQERPDVVFCVLMGYEIWTETLDSLRALGAVVINWGTDDDWKYASFSRFVAPHVDCWATTSRHAYERAARDGFTNVVLTQWAASGARLAAPVTAAACRHRVTFVGAAYGNRRRWIAALAARGIAVECFGSGWPNGPVTAEAVSAIFRGSMVSLNFGDSGVHWRGLVPYRSRQIKARVFEVPGAGGCLATEQAPHLPEFFVRGEEVVTFGSADELADEVRSLLGDPLRRDRIARAGHARAAREHTYEVRLARLLEAAFALRRRADRDGCVQADIDALVRRHRPRPWMRWAREALVGPLALAFGARRGARAARRLVHAASCAFAGESTYSAGGLPGRLFYRES